ncbi:MAG: sigma-70 family RNA polymerase sigma factor [Ruminococcaceae bacterium]|nr:sigma-70 family RNA polymerase sigma factor [Oscillospiraceae bacterium]
MLSYLISLIAGAFHLLLGLGNPGKFPPPLTAAEEHAAFLAARQGDSAARERLILHNLRLVAHIVRKYYGTAKNAEDLVSIGTIGLVKATDTFNPTNGARFATYAAKCIQNAILS